MRQRVSFMRDGSSMITVGKVRDAHGLKGELFVMLFAGEAHWVSHLKEATLVRNERVKQSDGTEKTELQSHVMKITRFKSHKKGLILKVDEISDRTQAESFAGAIFQIPNEMLVSQPGENIYLREIEDFEVEDQTLGAIGRVTGFSSNGAQDLVVIQSDQGSSEVPLVPEFVETLDFKNRKLRLNLPEGLVTKSL